MKLEDLNHLARHMLDALVRRVAQGDEVSTAAAMERAGLSEGAVMRGFEAYLRLDLPRQQEPACTFAQVHAWGEANGLRRAVLALTDPRSKGAEREVIEALRRGAEIEAALRQAARPKPAGPIEPGENIIRLKR